MSHSILSTECNDNTLSVHLTIPGDLLKGTYKRKLQQLIQERGTHVKGFRPGKANPKALEARFRPTAVKETISEHLDAIVFGVMKEQGYLGLGEVQVQHTPWDGSSTLEALASIPVWKLIAIDIDGLKQKMKGIEQPEEAAERRTLLLQQLLEFTPLNLDDTTIDLLKEMAEGMSDRSLEESIRETLLLDSLAEQLQVEVTDELQQEKLLELAMKHEMSMLEMEDYLQQPGVATTIYVDTRRDRALDLLAESIW